MQIGNGQHRERCATTRKREATCLSKSKEYDNSVLPLLSVGEMTLRLYGAFNYSQNSARDLRCALNGA